ncbi:2-dehydropantoate 2-reductase [Aeropyrum camini]|uniref:2-dehydropantoate 2-reductase n=1 Tax=Aeropyrum camini SY1 = JCM 12091 TaxID=1198449 RepID=U3TC16_9CREN|nr:2-dehydropantoate 2-reductase [Aeropyrum camini]BAN89971.1 2-dehydropantoate 2-reductase [Aeropyrum camini SY1 = JCM 12091]
MNAYCIVGMGGVGSLLAYYIHRATGRPPVAVVRRRRQAINLLAGLRLYGLIDAHVPIEPYEGSPPRRCRLSFIAVKAYDAAAAVEAASGFSDMVAVASNGWGGYERAVELGLDAAAIVVESGVSSMEAGLARVAGIGRLIVGSRGEAGDAALEAFEILRRGGAPAVMTGDIEAWRWLKAAANTAINLITSILGSRNGIVVENPGAWRLASKATSEVGLVASMLGYRLPEDPVGYTRLVALQTYDNESSTLQDLKRCRRSEAPYIAGRVVEDARRLGVGAPTVEALYLLFQALYTLRCGSMERLNPTADN